MYNKNDCFTHPPPPPKVWPTHILWPPLLVTSPHHCLLHLRLSMSINMAPTYSQWSAPTQKITHNVFGEVLDILQSQLLANYLQVTDRVYLSLNMSDIIVIKRSCTNVKVMWQEVWGMSNLRTTWNRASQLLMLDKKALPNPCIGYKIVRNFAVFATLTTCTCVYTEPMATFTIRMKFIPAMHAR